MAHKWARWLHNPYRLGGPHRFKAGNKIRGGPQVGKVAAQPLPPGGSAALQERGAKSKMAHKWAMWLHNPCRLGGPHRFRSGAGSEVAHKRARWLHNPPRGSPALQNRWRNHRRPTSGQGGYTTPTAWGVPTASKRGAKSEVAHKWARWLHNPCRLGDAHRFKSGGQDQRWPTSGQGGYITPAA